MKKLFCFAFTLALFFYSTTLTIAQAPQSFKYQAVARYQNGAVISNVSANVTVSILKDSLDAAPIFSETHSIITNNQGLFNLEVGTIDTIGFDSIEWYTGIYFLQTDLNGNTMGTNQILSVPFALHAETATFAESVKNGLTETDPVFDTSVASIITAGNIAAWNAASAGTVSGTEAVFDNWDKDGGDDFSGDYAALSNAPDLSDTAKYIDIESDPVFEAWDKSYHDLIDQPDITANVGAVLDTTSRFVRVGGTGGTDISGNASIDGDLNITGDITGGTFLTAETTSFTGEYIVTSTDWSATGIEVTKTTGISKVLITFTGFFDAQSVTSYANFVFSIDGVRVSHTMNGIFHIPVSTQYQFKTIQWIADVSAGTHNFELLAKLPGGGSIKIGFTDAFENQMSVIELR